MGGRRDPGPCPICGAAHTACTAQTAGPITLQQLPARDAAAAAALAEVPSPPLVAEVVQQGLPQTQVTTGTFRRKKA